MQLSSSIICRAASTDFPDSLLLFLSIIHRFQQVLDYILCSYGAVVDKFVLVSHHLLVRVKRFIGERRLSVRPYFSSNVQHVLSVLFVCFRDGRLVVVQLLF